MPVVPGRLTVAAFLTRWLAEVVAPHKAPETYRAYEQHVRLHLLPALGQYHLRRWSCSRCSPCSTPTARTAGSVATMTHMRDVLRNILNQAIAWRCCPSTWRC